MTASGIWRSRSQFSFLLFPLVVLSDGSCVLGSGALLSHVLRRNLGVD